MDVRNAVKVDKPVSGTLACQLEPNFVVVCIDENSVQRSEVQASGRGKGIDCLRWENVMRGMIRTILKLYLCPDSKAVDRQRRIGVGSPTTTNLEEAVHC
jgi:hypothetical protein